MNLCCFTLRLADFGFNLPIQLSAYQSITGDMSTFYAYVGIRPSSV